MLGKFARLLTSSRVTSWSETAFLFGVGLLGGNWFGGGNQLGTIGSVLSKVAFLFGGSITALNWLASFFFLGKPKNPPTPPRPTAIIWQMEEEPESRVSLPIPIPLKSKGGEQIADTGLTYNDTFLQELYLRNRNQRLSNVDFSKISDLDLSPILDKEDSPPELSVSTYSINVDFSRISDLDLSPILDKEYSPPELSVSTYSINVDFSRISDLDLSPILDKEYSPPDLSVSPYSIPNLSLSRYSNLSRSLSSTTDLSISPLSASVGVDDYFPEGAWDEENDLDFSRIIAGADETSAPRATPIESGEVAQNVDKKVEGALTHHKILLSEREGDFFKFKRRIHSSGDLRNYIPKNSPVQKGLLIRAQSAHAVPKVRLSSSRAPRNRNPDSGSGALPAPDPFGSGKGRLSGEGESSAAGHHKIRPD